MPNCKGFYKVLAPPTFKVVTIYFISRGATHLQILTGLQINIESLVYIGGATVPPPGLLSIPQNCNDSFVIVNG